MVNQDRFSGKAEVYAVFRPSYPDEFIDYLYSEVGFTDGSTIADIGSGTGIFTKFLLERGSTLYGVEPNHDMRSTAEKELAGFSNFISVNASAEDTKIKEKSVDFITSSQAFHWFSRELFKLECGRILKGDGKVILIWNMRDESSDLIIENYNINKKHCPDFNGFSGGMRDKSPEQFSDFFKDGICEHKIFPNHLTFDEAGFVGRNLSSSYAPNPKDKNYGVYINDVRKLFEKYSESGCIQMPNYTHSYTGAV